MNKDDMITAVLGQLQQQLAQGSGLEWRLGSGALLQCWKPYKGDFFNGQTANRGALGMHHYEGAVAGTEQLVSVEVNAGGGPGQADDGEPHRKLRWGGKGGAPEGGHRTFRGSAEG